MRFFLMIKKVYIKLKKSSYFCFLEIGTLVYLLQFDYQTANVYSCILFPWSLSTSIANKHINRKYNFPLSCSGRLK